MGYRIRPSTVSDTEVLGQVHAQSWHESYADFIPADILAKVASVERRTAIRREMFQNTTPDWAHFLVENDEGEIVGFADCGPAYEVKDYAPAEIFTLYLLRSAQGKGLGGQLVQKMLGHLSARGFEKAGLRVFADKQSSVGFYQHMLGQEAARTMVEFVGVSLPTIVFLWPDLKNSY